MFLTILYVVIGLVALVVVATFLMIVLTAISFKEGDVQLEYLDDFYEVDEEHDVRPILGVVFPKSKEK